MERRKEPRLEAGASVQVTVLSGERAVMTGTVMEESLQCLTLRLPVPVAPDAAIQLEDSGAILLGEVRHYEPAGDGYRVGVTIRHRLSQLAQLCALSRQLHGHDESVPAARP